MKKKNIIQECLIWMIVKGTSNQDKEDFDEGLSNLRLKFDEGTLKLV